MDINDIKVGQWAVVNISIFRDNRPLGTSAKILSVSEKRVKVKISNSTRTLKPEQIISVFDGMIEADNVAVTAVETHKDFQKVIDRLAANRDEAVLNVLEGK